jgi:hypothetical protein
MEENLTLKQAYDAMYAYLIELHERFGYDQLGGLLGGMSTLEDGSTADPATWTDWLKAAEKATQGKVDTKLNLRK